MSIIKSIDQELKVTPQITPNIRENCTLQEAKTNSNYISESGSM
jgi:hypothetical protein